jgi:hypothetical protein
MIVSVDIAEFDENGRLIAVTSGSLSDMSKGGIGLITKKLIYVGSKIAIRMKSKNGYVTYGAVVQTSRYTTKVGHCSGCSWMPKSEAIPTANQIENFLMRFKAG